MKNCSNLKILSFILLFCCQAFIFSASASGNNENDKEESGQLTKQERLKRAAASGGLSQDALEKMKIEQDLENLSSDIYAFSENATYNFEKRGAKALSPLLEHLKNNRNNQEIVSDVIYALGRLGEKARPAVPVIASYVNFPDRDMKITAMSALARIGKYAEKAIPNIKKNLYSDDEWIRTVAKRTLEDIGTRSALITLKEMEKYNLLLKKKQNLQNKVQTEQQ